MTAQAPDWLVFRGKRRMLFSNPLEPFLRQLPTRPEFRLQSTAHWRGYVATWTIEDDRLFLSGLQTQVDREGDPGINLVFPKATGPVPADWVSFRLRSPDGEQVRYVHMSYQSQYAQEMNLWVRAGRLVAFVEVDVRTGRQLSWEATPHLELEYGVDQGAFIRSSIAHPGDPAPLLAYADWLEERSDIRAEVVRALADSRISQGTQPLRSLSEASRRRAFEDPTWAGLVGLSAIPEG